MRRWKSAVFVSLSIACTALACSLQDGGTYLGDSVDGSKLGDGTFGDGSQGDGSSAGDGSQGEDSGDASTDAGVDSAPGVTYACASPLANVAHCKTDCPIAPFECPLLGTCISDCATCGQFVCDACFVDGGPAVARCEPQDAAAFAECLTGFNRCFCNGPPDCPGNAQTCDNHGCFECGEPDAGNLDDNDMCKNGGGGKHCTGGTNFGKCM